MRLRRRRVPAGVTLRPGERVLAVGSDVVATTDALHLPGTDGHLRLPWERVEQATWDDGVLAVREVDGAQHRIALTDPGSVPETVHERVTATVVLSTHVRLPGGGVRIVGRRPARAADEVRWSFVFDPGLNPRDPGLLAQAEQALEDLRRQMGV